MKRRTTLAWLGGVAAAPGTFAQPSRPIRLIVPYPPGGPLDVTARALAQAVHDTLGTVIVENRAGAGGNLGADLVAKAAPDGLTIGIGAVATHAINPWLYRRMPYDPIKDFTPITRIAQVPNVLVMNADTASRLKIGELRDLVAYAKRHPGQLNYGSGGNGSAGHLAGELFKSQAGVFLVHIPYAGGNPAQLALLSGQVDLNFDNLATASTNIKAGKLKALAVTTARRASAMPEVPTIAEAGYPDYEMVPWIVIVAPRGLPAPVREPLARALKDTLADPATRADLEKAGLDVGWQAGSAYDARVAQELPLLRAYVHKAGIPLE